MERTDEELLERVARADQAALRTLHLRHAQAVYGFVWRMLDDVGAAEDVVAETFVEVWRRAGRFAGRSAVRTWIIGIARHKALDALRVRARSTEDSWDDDTLLQVADDGPTPFDVLLARQNAAAVRLCMQALPAAQREALHLQWVEEMTLEQIAQLTGTPANTVATRVHHAKRKLRDCLARQLGLDRLDRRKDQDRTTKPT